MIPIFDALMPVLSKVLDFIPDPQKKAEAQLKLQTELDANSQAILNALSEVDKSQAAINVEEAKSSSLFIAGGRPAIIWICATAFGWTYVLQPMVVFILVASGHPIKELPVLNMSEMMPVLLGILGLGGMRSWERVQGVERNSLK
jgi:hypothetical protein